jgi:hypothetical protein
MYRPVATITPIFGSVQVNTNGDGSAFLSCGKPNYIAGITVSNSLISPDIFLGGTNWWVQVFTNTSLIVQDDSQVYYTNVFNHPGPWLDDDPTIAQPDRYTLFADDRTSPVDSPYILLGATYATGQVSESLQMTMMFTAPGFGLPVPLVTLPWSWKAQTTNQTDKFGWTLRVPLPEITNQPVMRNPWYPVWKSYWTDSSNFDLGAGLPDAH